MDQISLHKTEQMVDALGRRLERCQQEIKDLFDLGGGVAVTEEITGTMVVCIDAGKAPTKGNERIDDDGRNRYDREFRAHERRTIRHVGALKQCHKHT